ncbi:hypothetical protein RhiirA1_405903, partial [Rhizophagus irregularis]
MAKTDIYKGRRIQISGVTPEVDDGQYVGCPSDFLCREEGDALVSKKLGRDVLYDVMKQYDVPYIFGNPGTSELPFIEGELFQEEIEYISALHEANAVGMAMG